MQFVPLFEVQWVEEAGHDNRDIAGTHTQIYIYIYIYTYIYICALFKFYVNIAGTHKCVCSFSTFNMNLYVYRRRSDIRIAMSINMFANLYICRRIIREKKFYGLMKVSPFYWHDLSEIKTSISNNPYYIMWDVNMNPWLIHLLRKPHNALFLYPTMHHLVTKHFICKHYC